MIRWYGAGGVNNGLPHYVTIDRKPENGCEIQNAACGKTGIMMELHVVKGPAEERLELENDDKDLGHGCKIMLHLLQYWSSAKCQIVCADSYFASVQAACRLFDLNFRFIGVIKTATKLFPKAYLGKVELPIRGTVAALTSVHDGVQLLAFVYCDRDCHYISQLVLTLQVVIQFVGQGCDNCNPSKRTSHQNRLRSN
jgi:Transposase IS4